MMRLIAALLLFAASSVLGFCMAGRLKLRVQSLGGWLQVLTELDREIRYASTLLGPALKNAAAQCPDGKEIFCQTGSALEQNRRKDALAAFDEIACALADKQCEMLTEEDYAVLRPLFAGLGKSDTMSQCALIQDTRAQVSAHRTAVDMNCRSKGRLYRTMGVLLGAIGAVVLM